MAKLKMLLKMLSESCMQRARLSANRQRSHYVRPLPDTQLQELAKTDHLRRGELARQTAGWQAWYIAVFCTQ
jgi:hypothetical protein